MKKLSYFYIDDVIWLFRDLSRERPASIYDNSFMKMLKEAHDKYGMKVQLNIFLRTDFYYGNDEFCLSEMPDCCKDEFEEECIAKGIESAEFFGYATREEYFYPEYFAYQPDYAEKVLKAA